MIKRLAIAMVEGGGGQGDVPAGYTYLGQFVDHDLTFDRTDVALGEDVTPAELRAGTLGRVSTWTPCTAWGRANPASAKFYEADGLHLKVGTTKKIGSDAAKKGHDLPRVDGERTALIPDPRNDENLIVAQTHVAMMNFHNRVVDDTSAPTTAQHFRKARKQVTLHYQWMLRHDYLPRILDPAVVDDVFTNGRVLVEPDAAPTDVPTMPLGVLGRGVPARPQHGARLLQLEPPFPGYGGLVVLHVRLLGRRRQPRWRS